MEYGQRGWLHCSAACLSERQTLRRQRVPGPLMTRARSTYGGWEGGELPIRIHSLRVELLNVTSWGPQ